MADRLAAFPETRAKPTISRYPWAAWMDGSVWRIMRNRDYIVSTRNMENTIYNRAKRSCTDDKKFKVRITKLGPDTLAFQFYDPTQQAEGVSTNGAQSR